MRTAGLVLAGGASRRMGTPKPGLGWGRTTLLGHVVAVVADAVDGGPIVVSARGGQDLPPLDPPAERVDDLPGQGGPLVGIVTGLDALVGRAEVVLVVACDLPLITAAVLRGLVGEIRSDVDAVVPVVDGHPQPLAAAYALTALAALRVAHATGVAGPRAVLPALRVVYLDVADAVPFLNVNDPAALAHATRIVRDA